MKIRTFALTTGAAALAATTLVAGPAGAANGEAVKPTKEQKAAVVKAWSKANGGSFDGPLKCFKVRLSKTNKNLAGLTSNAAKYEKACAAYAFDGAAILYGHKKKKWFLLTEGSDLSNAECKATARLVGEDPWADLAKFAGLLGCENV